MSPARALILFCGVLVVSGCGSAAREQPADNHQVSVLPRPPIEAINEPAPDMWWLDEPDDGAATSTYICAQEDKDATDDRDCQPTPEVKEQLRRQGEEFRRATTPATGSKPHAIAMMRLEDRGPGSRMRLIAWKSQSGKLCLADDETSEEGGGGGGPFGPCEPGGHCGDICLTYSGNLGRNGWSNTAAGVFPAKADLLRVTFDTGRVGSYRLDGPLVPGFPEYRVFMLDLGRGFETRLELFDGEKLIAEEKRSSAEILMERCSQRYPVHDMPRTREEAEQSPLARCFEKAGSE